MTYDSTAPPTANLPLNYSGIRDGRLSFANQFRLELVNSSDRPIEDFIHLPPNLAGPNPVIATPAVLTGTSILIAPGLFGECVDAQALPFTDGQIRNRHEAYTSAYEALKSNLGAYSVSAIRLSGRGGSDTNGERIAQALIQLENDSAVRSIIVIGYSKGSADTLHALAQLAREGQMPHKPMAFVSVAGAVMGSPIADRYAHLYSKLQGLIEIDACPGSQGTDLVSITRQYRSNWLAKAQIPNSVAMYSLVAHTQRASIAPALLPFYDLLSVGDPRNDGQVIASDAILPNSTLLAEVRSDHWDLAIPLSASRNALTRSITSQRQFPRDALFLAIVRHVSGDLERKSMQK